MITGPISSPFSSRLTRARPDQIRPSRARRIVTMAKSAGLNELLSSPFDGGRIEQQELNQ